MRIPLRIICASLLVAAACTFHFAQGHRDRPLVTASSADVQPAATTIAAGAAPATMRPEPAAAAPDDGIDMLIAFTSLRTAPGGQRHFIKDGFLYEWWHPADINRDGALDFQDVMEFQHHWLTGGAYGDYNRDGVIDARDVKAFIESFNDDEWRDQVARC
jgi:hypothetical protein